MSYIRNRDIPRPPQILHRTFPHIQCNASCEVWEEERHSVFLPLLAAAYRMSYGAICILSCGQPNVSFGRHQS